MKIGLVTLYDYNYGSALQCYSTLMFLNSLEGCKCDLIAVAPPISRIEAGIMYYRNLFREIIGNTHYTSKIIKAYTDTTTHVVTITEESKKAIAAFVSSYLCPTYYSEKELYSIGHSVDYNFFFTGSDQVWNGARIKNKYSYFLQFADAKKKVAWAPSLGSDTIAEYNVKSFKRDIESFQHLSVREKNAAALINRLSGRTPKELFDPVVLHSATAWRDEYEKRKTTVIDAEYCLLFFIDEPNDKAKSKLIETNKNSNLKYISFGYYYACYTQLLNHQHIDGNPFDFLSVVDRAKYVFTDSFHATLFSVIFHTNFTVFERAYKGENQSGRILRMLEIFGLSKCYEPEILSIDNIDFSEVDNRLGERRNQYFEYLMDIFGYMPSRTIDSSFIPSGEELLCTGCGACSEICMKKAISFVIKEGHRYPHLNQEKCVRCGVCSRICPVNNQIGYKTNNIEKKAYIGYAVDKQIALNSTSGGVFAAIAEWFLASGGLVYGAAIGKNVDGALVCKHIRVESVDKLCLIQGSKYVQSDITDVFDEIKEQLQNGRKVLFSGTSCQVAAVKNYVGRVLSTALVTVDFVCHGVLDHSFFDDYIKYLEKKYKLQIENISFRKHQDLIERSHFDSYKLYLQATNGKRVEIDREKSAYYSLFMDYAGYRASCYNCLFANINKPADITLGDYFTDRMKFRELRLEGKLEENRPKSMIVVHSRQGAELINKTNLMCCEIPVQTAVSDHRQLQESSKRSVRGDYLFSLYLRSDIEHLQKVIERKNCETKVLTVMKKLSKRKNKDLG